MRRLSSGLAVALLAVSLLGPAASAKSVSVTLRPKGTTMMTVRQPLKRTGEWAVKVRMSSDGAKVVKIRARRGNGVSFSVLNTANSADTASCNGAAGTLFCDQITVPAVPAPGTWTFTIKNAGSRPTTVTLNVTWRAVGAAG